LATILATLSRVMRKLEDALASLDQRLVAGLLTNGLDSLVDHRPDGHVLTLLLRPSGSQHVGKELDDGV